MTTLSLDLTKTVTARESELATELQVAALTNNSDEIARLMRNPIIKELFKRGVLKTSHPIPDGARPVDWAQYAENYRHENIQLRKALKECFKHVPLFVEDRFRHLLIEDRKTYG